MSVFLRWGVFGILSVAAVLYAYNASKDLAKRRPPPPVATVTPAETAETVPAISVSADCEVEVVVAQRAIEARDASEPLDRLLRIREIVFAADETRRERLIQVAKRWFGYAGAIGPFSVRRDAAAECEQSAVVAQP